MTSKLVPSDPASVTVTRAITKNIITFSAPFSRFGRVRIGGRSTAVRLQNGAVAVFSPTALTPAVKEAVTSLGDVRYLAALDVEHHIFLGDWHKAYPSATIIGVEGLPEKRAKDPEMADVPFGVVFTEKNKKDLKIDEAFDTDFEYEYVGAHGNKELVFCYKPERTLIEADLLFNLPATEQYSKSPESATEGFLTRLFTGLMNARGNAIWQRRFLWYATSKGNGPREEFNRSVARISKFDFDRLIPCHGDVIETGGKEIFKTVMEWHLKANQSKL